MQVILASQSPRRQELLKLFNVPFVVRIADIDETMDQADPYDEVARVSRLKAMAVSREADDVVIAADTVVVCDGAVLGKPKDEADAHRMLRLLSGRDHQVMTGLTVLRGENILSCTEIEDYIRTGDPMDKAGSYGIQGGAALFVEKLQGDYFNVVGLPVCRLGKLLKKIAPELF